MDKKVGKNLYLKKLNKNLEGPPKYIDPGIDQFFWNKLILLGSINPSNAKIYRSINQPFDHISRYNRTPKLGCTGPRVRRKALLVFPPVLRGV